MTLGDFDHKARLMRHFWLTYNKKNQEDLKKMMVTQGRRVYKEMKAAVVSGKIKKTYALKKIKEYKLEGFLEILKYEQ
jgi:hypothetical protein